MISKELGFALDVAAEAGKVIAGFYQRRMEQIWTNRSHFKTAADDASDAVIRKMVRDRFPNHNILSEEGGYSEKGSLYTWVWDAVDGTIPMFTGISDHFAICGALFEGRKPILGVANAVKRGEMYYAEIGGGSYCNGNEIKVSSETEIGHVICCIESGKDNRVAHIPFMEKAYGPGGVIVCLEYGCASLPLLFVARGMIHAHLATSLEPEDMAAAAVIIQEAGGRVTNLSGEEWKLGDRSILAANPTLHEKLSKFFELF